MAQWIKATDKIPHLKEQILATLVESGERKVIACWYVEGNRIMLDRNPNSQTYSYGLVHAWQPFPEPFEEKEFELDYRNTAQPG